MNAVGERAPNRDPNRYAADREEGRCVRIRGGVTPFGTALSNWSKFWRCSLFISIALLSVAHISPAADTLIQDLVLVGATAVSPQSIRALKAEGFRGVAIILDEQTANARIDETARELSAQELALYWWIEVARNPELADAHPRWMASLGMHDDWKKRFPGSRLPGKGEVAKAWPWVPIWYREAFDAHLKRIERLLATAPTTSRGILLNDLQGGPASCGCGNLQCRWATDYHVKATAEHIEGDDAPAEFLAAVRRLNASTNKVVIPVWTTECEEEDLPANRRNGQPSTGLCGTVGCAVGLCPKEFSKQWSALLRGTDSPIALLGLHRELERTSEIYGPAPGWLTNAVRYLDKVPAAQGSQALSHDRLWVIVQGTNRGEETAGRRIAKQLGASTVVIDRVHIDQSYQLRVISIN
jgi:hypothetical protein